MIKIEYTSLEKAESYRQAVKSVCEEKIFLSNSTGFAEADTLDFIEEIIEENWVQFFALDGEKVVGWCDILPIHKEYHAHVGTLGVGVIKEYRGQGIGRLLMETAIENAKIQGLEKIELEVFASNENAKKLYKKIGFTREGIKKNAKKFKGEYEDVEIWGMMIV